MAVAPPRPKDLALTALRAFEAAARLGSFAQAAQELGVTPGAVTAHVKGLEASLAAPLFSRTPRGVTLSAVGQRALPGFTAAFDAPGSALHTLRAAAVPPHRPYRHPARRGAIVAVAPPARPARGGPGNHHLDHRDGGAAEPVTRPL